MSSRTKFGKVILDENEDKWLRKHYKHTKNEDIAEHLGVSNRTIIRLARERALEKSRQFINKCNQTALEKAHAGALAADVLFKKGEWNHAGVEHQFKKGITSVQRIGKKREKARIRKSAETRRKTIQSERRRILFGLEQRTGLRLVKECRKKTSQRLYLRKRGYQIYGKESIAYYTEDTNRSPLLEKDETAFFKFAPLKK